MTAENHQDDNEQAGAEKGKKKIKRSEAARETKGSPIGVHPGKCGPLSRSESPSRSISGSPSGRAASPTPTIKT